MKKTKKAAKKAVKINKAASSPSAYTKVKV